MGFFDKVRRAFQDRPTEAPPAPAPPPSDDGRGTPRFTPRQLTKQLARRLATRYPEGIPPEVLTEAAASAGLDPDAVAQQVQQDRQTASEVRRKVRSLDPATLHVLDIREVESTRTRIKGSSYWATDNDRRRFGGAEYLLVCEPDNEVDPNAVAVYGVAGRKLGHLSEARAASLSPILSQVPGAAYRVTGEGATPTSIMLWVNVPKVGPLRAFMRSNVT